MPLNLSPLNIKLSNNSSETLLGANEEFIGEWVDAPSRDIGISCLASVPGTIFIDFSDDGGSTVSSVKTLLVNSDQNKFRVFTKLPRAFRIRYLNGPGEQSYFSLSTYLGEFRQQEYMLNAVLQKDTDAIIVRSLSEEATLAQGLLEGYSSINIFGENIDISIASVPEDIWEDGGSYTGFPSGAAEVLQVFSSSADDNIAGVGARIVTIIGLDENYNQISEKVEMNGITPVLTTNSFSRVNEAFVFEAGSNNANVGTITVRHNITVANIFQKILPGNNRAFSTNYTIPLGYSGYIRKFNLCLYANPPTKLRGLLKVREPNKVFVPKKIIFIDDSNSIDGEIPYGISVPEKTDIIVTVTSITSNNVAVIGGYDLILVSDN